MVGAGDECGGHPGGHVLPCHDIPLIAAAPQYCQEQDAAQTVPDLPPKTVSQCDFPNTCLGLKNLPFWHNDVLNP